MSQHRVGKWSILPDMSRLDPQRSLPVALFRAAHPRQALLTAAGLAAAAAMSGRLSREVGLVFVTVLVGQTILGWHNDLVDRDHDARHDLPRKPIAQRQVDPGTVMFSFACAILLVVPLAVANGVIAGAGYLISLVIGMLGNVAFRAGALSWLPWAASYALYPAFLSYGGWGGEGTTTPPTISMTVLAALLGVAVHFLRALPGLVQDNQEGIRSLPLRIAIRTGAPKLLVLSIICTVAIGVGVLITGQTVGLRQ